MAEIDKWCKKLRCSRCKQKKYWNEFSPSERKYNYRWCRNCYKDKYSSSPRHHVSYTKRYDKPVNERRKNFNHIRLFENPFPEEIPVHYHHVNDTITVPIPEKIHMICSCGGCFYDIVTGKFLYLSHREMVNMWIERLYGISISKLLSPFNEEIEDGEIVKTEWFL